MAWTEDDMRQIIAEQQAELYEARQSQWELKQENKELRQRIKDLSGLTPACGWCCEGDDE